MNRNFQKQYQNDITQTYVLRGYNDVAFGKVYDKWYRYETRHEHEYLMGAQAAINNGGVVENYINSSATAIAGSVA